MKPKVSACHTTHVHLQPLTSLPIPITLLEVLNTAWRRVRRRFRGLILSLVLARLPFSPRHQVGRKDARFVSLRTIRAGAGVALSSLSRTLAPRSALARSRCVRMR